MRLELSLSSRSVTIGTAALAYLRDAACRAEGKRRTVAAQGKERVRERERAAEAETKRARGGDRKRKAKCVFMVASGLRVACISGMGRGPVKTGRTLP